MTPQERERRAEARRTLAWHERAYGPQLPGGTYRNGYWGKEYTVEAMWSDLAGPWRHAPSQRDRDADGSVREHCTPWDARRDRVVRQPERAARSPESAPPRARVR
jgi:hypothetical protein